MKVTCLRSHRNKMVSAFISIFTVTFDILIIYSIHYFNITEDKKNMKYLQSHLIYFLYIPYIISTSLKIRKT